MQIRGRVNLSLRAVISIVASVKSSVRGPGSAGPCRVLACDHALPIFPERCCVKPTETGGEHSASQPGWTWRMCRREKQVSDGRRVLFAGVHHHVRRLELYGVTTGHVEFANPPRLSTTDRRLAALATNDRPVGGARRRLTTLADARDQILKTILVTGECGDRARASPMPTSGPASSSARPVSPISGHPQGWQRDIHWHGVGQPQPLQPALCSATSSKTRSITSRTIYADALRWPRNDIAALGPLDRRRVRRIPCRPR